MLFLRLDERYGSKNELIRGGILHESLAGVEILTAAVLSRPQS
jgi:hypothetical protein